jgi:hypothetical protein
VNLTQWAEKRENRLVDEDPKKMLERSAEEELKA